MAGKSEFAIKIIIYGYNIKLKIKKIKGKKKKEIKTNKREIRVFREE